MQQAQHLADLPFAVNWIALMPDTHSGYGMPIGGILATRDVIVPNAVGVDIGCGMIFVKTDLPAELLVREKSGKNRLAQTIIGDIMRQVPTGFGHHKDRQSCTAVDNYAQALKQRPVPEEAQELLKELEKARFQVGTLGSGNHFIELQIADDGFLGIMVHSGSRNVGYTICNFFNQMARQINARENSPVPSSWDLAYLATDSVMGREYIYWMNFALEFARENRARMMKTVIDIVSSQVKNSTGVNNIVFSEPVNCHHNYASREEHYGQSVWIHRKGAIRAGLGELGIIPGAMGSYSYLVKGRGNPESFCSCSHGAGRLMSRSAARKKFSVDGTIADLNSRGVFLGKAKRHDIAEESRFAYKDIDSVIANELDLIEPILALKTLAVVKG